MFFLCFTFQRLPWLAAGARPRTRCSTASARLTRTATPWKRCASALSCFATAPRPRVQRHLPSSVQISLPYVFYWPCQPGECCSRGAGWVQREVEGGEKAGVGSPNKKTWIIADRDVWTSLYLSVVVWMPDRAAVLCAKRMIGGSLPGANMDEQILQDF